MAPAQRGSRIVFVGNIPYDRSEEQLAEVFSEVGKVVEFRLIFDNETGKPKGYGFCEFEDPETAASAVRNLNGITVSGRSLRIDYAGEDPKLDKSGHHGGQPHGDAGHTVPPKDWGKPHGASGALPPNLPQGQPLPNGLASTDAISQTLAALPPNQLLDILGQMRSFVTTSPEQAKNLLTSYPQLAYALFQAMLMMNIVDPAVLQRMLTASTQNAPNAGAGMPAQQQPGFGAPGMGMQQEGPPMGMPQGGQGAQAGPGPTGWGPQRMPHMAAGQRGTPPPMGAQGPRPPQGGGAPGMYGQQMQPGPMAGYPGQAGRPSQPQGMPGMPGMGMPGMSGMPGMGGMPGMAGMSAGGGNLGDEQRQLLQQVLSLTPEQINALPPDQKGPIMQLRAQFQA